MEADKSVNTLGNLNFDVSDDAIQRNSLVNEAKMLAQEHLQKKDLFNTKHVEEEVLLQNLTAQEITKEDKPLEDRTFDFIGAGVLASRTMAGTAGAIAGVEGAFVSQASKGAAFFAADTAGTVASELAIATYEAGVDEEFSKNHPILDTSIKLAIGLTAGYKASAAVENRIAETVAALKAKEIDEIEALARVEQAKKDAQRAMEVGEKARADYKQQSSNTRREAKFEEAGVYDSLKNLEKTKEDPLSKIKGNFTPNAEFDEMKKVKTELEKIEEAAAIRFAEEDAKMLEDAILNAGKNNPLDGVKGDFTDPKELHLIMKGETRTAYLQRLSQGVARVANDLEVSGRETLDTIFEGMVLKDKKQAATEVVKRLEDENAVEAMKATKFQLEATHYKSREALKEDATHLQKYLEKPYIAGNKEVQTLVKNNDVEGALLKSMEIEELKRTDKINRPSTDMYAYTAPETIAGIIVGANAGYDEETGEFDIGKGLMYGLAAAAGVYGFRKVSDNVTTTTKGETEDAVVKAVGDHFTQSKEFNIDRLETVQKALKEKLKDPDLNPKTRARYEAHIKNLEKATTTMHKVENLDDLVKMTKDKGMKKYLEAKIKPVVNVDKANLNSIKEALKNNDLIKASEGIEFNFERIDTNDEVLDLINTTSALATKVMDDGVRATHTTERNAAVFGMSMNTVNKLAKDTQNLDAKMLASRMILVKVQEDVLAMSKKISSGEGSPKDELEFARLINLSASVQAQVKSSQKEIARALRNMQLSAKASKFTLEEAEMDAVLKSVSLGNSKEAANKLLEFGKGDEIFSNQAARALSNGSFMSRANDAVTEIWINGLLSNPATHLANVMSNTVVAIDGLFEQLGRAGDLLEAKAALVGFMQGVTEGFRLAGKAIKTGDPELDSFFNKLEGFDAVSSKYLLKGDSQSALLDGLGKAIRLPGNALLAEDEFFKSITYRMRLRAESYKVAKQEGLTGQDLGHRVEELVKDVDSWHSVRNKFMTGATDNKDGFEAMEEFLQMSDDQAKMLEDLYETSINMAREKTFTNPLGEKGRSIQNVQNKVPGVRFIIPFIRTPVNIVKMAVNRMGGDLVQRLYPGLTKGDWSKVTDPTEAKTMMYRLATGGAIMYGASQLANEGMITGGLPTKNYTMQEAGWKPYSIKIGETYYQYSRLDPMAMFLGISADIHTMMESQDKVSTKSNEMISMAAFALINNLVNKTYMSGISDFMEAMNSDSSTGYERWGKNFIASFVPSASYGVARELDPVQREVRTIQDYIINKIPIARESLEPKIDYRGNVKTYEGSSLTPIAQTNIKSDKLSSEIRRLKMNFQKPDNRINTVEMSDEMYTEYMQLIGEAFEKRATKLVDSKGYDRMSEGLDADSEIAGAIGGKEYALKKARTEAKKEARQKLFKKYPEFRDEVSLKKRLMKRLRGLKKEEENE